MIDTLLTMKGMVDPGELVTTTLKREFAEEALNSLELDDQAKDDISKAVDKVFQNGVEVCPTQFKRYSLLSNKYLYMYFSMYMYMCYC